jgi:tetratricopeptide (TPR) repeat protein
MEGHDEKKQPIVVNGGAIIHCTAKIEAQLAEARQELARAEKHTKRHWSNAWRKAKLRKAGSHYGQAARLFYQTGDTDAAKAALLKAYDCYKSKRSWYWAAKTLEQAIRIAQERQDLDGLAEVAWKAAAVYDKAGQPDSAAYLLERVAKSLEDQQPIICSLMLEKAAETVETENRPILAAYYVNKLLLMSLARSDLSDATLKSRKLVALYQVSLGSLFPAYTDIVHKR